jgi:hypothetical protein
MDNKTLMNNIYLRGKNKLTKRQKEINKGLFTRQPKKKTESTYRRTYWCPIEEESYIATYRHEHCKLCFSAYAKKDLHKIIEI